MNSGASARERELLLSCQLASVRAGRHFVRDTLLEWDLERLVEDAELGVSELVANAVRYAKTDVLIKVSADTQVTIAVVDRDPVLHRPVHPTPDDLLAESGRGLRIVAAVADDWGIEARTGGKSIWFSLALPDRATANADLHSINEGSTRGDRVEQQSDPRTAVVG